jgi:hypothetical protein
LQAPSHQPSLQITRDLLIEQARQSAQGRLTFKACAVTRKGHDIQM